MTMGDRIYELRLSLARQACRLVLRLMPPECPNSIQSQRERWQFRRNWDAPVIGEQADNVQRLREGGL